MANEWRNRTPPQFLAIGHVTIDVNRHIEESRQAGRDAESDGKGRPRREYGGAAAYAAATAKRLGLSPAVVTSAARDYPFADVTPGVEVRSQPARATTTFENLYQARRRAQVLLSRAAGIDRSSAPSTWLSAGITLLCPLARELPLDALRWGFQGIIGLSPQGWLRDWDGAGRITVRSSPPPGLLGRADVVVASSDELDGSNAREWGALAPVVVITQRERGCEVYLRSRRFCVPAPEVTEVDPTGSGDVWAAAYLVRYSETRDPLSAARFASCAASLSVTGQGLSAIPARSEVERVLLKLPGTVEA